VQYRKGPFNKPENYVRECGGVVSDSTDTYVPPSRSNDEGVLF
jgi:penicillin-binding protein 1A